MPAPATYPLKTICKLLDLSERRVQQLSAEGVIPRAERGRYELEAAIRGYVHYLRDRSLDGGVVSLEEARKRKIAAEAELAEIELAKARADVVAIDDVAKQWDTILANVRTRFLALPTKVAPMVAPETDQSLVKEFIEDAVHTALGELARGLSDDTGSNAKPDAGVSKQPAKNAAPNKAKSKRVGRPRKKAKSGS